MADREPQKNEQEAEDAGEKARNVGSDDGSSPPTRPKSSSPPRGPSTPPPPPWRPINNLRIVFAVAWIATQLALVVTADRRVDGALGFRMFPESSWIKVALYREVEGPGGELVRMHTEDGVWGARGVDGTVRRVTWYDRVPAPYWVFDRDMPASYGAATQLSRLQAALDDMAAHVPDDAETRRFLLDVTVRRNGREPTTHQLASRPRAVVVVVAPSTPRPAPSSPSEPGQQP